MFSDEELKTILYSLSYYEFILKQCKTKKGSKESDVKEKDLLNISEIRNKIENSCLNK